jgi:hypothetical protein
MLHLDAVVGNDYRMDNLLGRSSFDLEWGVGASQWNSHVIGSKMHRQPSLGRELWRDA